METQEQQIRNIAESYVETAGNKLYDVTTLLRLAEQRGMGARGMSTNGWVKLSRVIRHALAEVGERLCTECSSGDLIPAVFRVDALQKRAQLIAEREDGRSLQGTFGLRERRADAGSGKGSESSVISNQQ